MVGNALRKAADVSATAIEDECLRKPLHSSTYVRVTSAGGKLNCKYIFHVHVSDKDSEFTAALRDNVLTTADRMAISSIAIPTLGCGTYSSCLYCNGPVSTFRKKGF